MKYTDDSGTVRHTIKTIVGELTFDKVPSADGRNLVSMVPKVCPACERRHVRGGCMQRCPRRVLMDIAACRASTCL